MAQRNTYRKNNPEDHFDLDDYINEKSNPEADSRTQNFENEKKSSWFKNTVLVLGLSMITLLYFNDWSPTQVYGNIFGVEKYQAGFEPAQQVPNRDIIVTGSSEETALAQLERLEELGNLEALEGLSNLESLEGLQELEGSLSGLQDLEEMNKLRSFALETAMEALSKMGESEEFGEAIGSSAQLGVQEALRELQNLRELEINGVDQVVTDAINVNASFNDYSNELEQVGISEVFSTSDLQKIHQANVPSSFLKQLHDLNLLEKLDADSIIEVYNAKD